MHLMFGGAERDAEQWYDPYWQLYDIAPRLVDDVQQVLRTQLGVSPSAPEAFNLDAATAGALDDRLRSGEIATVESLRNVPPELAAIWGVHELITTAIVVRPRVYPPEPVLRLPPVSASVRYIATFTKYLEPRHCDFTDFQLHTATRSNNSYNGHTTDLTVRCLVAVRTEDNLRTPLPLEAIAQYGLIKIGTTSIEAQGAEDFTVYN